MVDGASVWRQYWQIIMPLCRPPLAALATLEFTWIYNDFFWALVLMQTRRQAADHVGAGRVAGAVLHEQQPDRRGVAGRRAADADRLLRAAAPVHRRPHAGLDQGMIALGPGGLVLHWGAEVELSALALEPPVARAALDVPVRPRLLNERARGWRGRESVIGSRRLPAFEWDGLTARAGDVVVRTEIEHSPSGVARLRHTITADEPFELHRWRSRCRSRRSPPRCSTSAAAGAASARRSGASSTHGTWLREQRRGRTGFDTPLLLVAGTPGFGWRSGEVWGIHLGWSGDARLLGRAAAGRQRRPSPPPSCCSRARSCCGRVHDPVAVRRVLRPRPRRAVRRVPRVPARAAEPPRAAPARSC